MIKRSSFWVGLGILLILVLAVSALARGNNPTDNANKATPQPTSSINGNDYSNGGVTTTQPDDSEVSSDNTVLISNSLFSPTVITVRSGTTVIWNNQDSVAHTVNADQSTPLPGLASGTINPGESYSFTFNETGTWNYYCSIHPNMTGKVIVIP